MGQLTADTLTAVHGSASVCVCETLVKLSLLGDLNTVLLWAEPCVMWVELKVRSSILLIM